MRNGPFDLAALLRGTVAGFRSLSEKHTLVADIPDELPEAYGDPIATDIMVGQLLENAAKYSPPGSTISVTVRPGTDCVTVSIADQGAGITAEERAQLGRRSFRGERHRDVHDTASICRIGKPVMRFCGFMRNRPSGVIASKR